ncbi:tail fiber domain-containing protein [Barnesiella sp. An22]|uniref:tail fiber domain-containing protein n=1 Tax=Barnesiella sp. An22 TaxID=1965590 RepID=UPI003207C416
MKTRLSILTVACCLSASVMGQMKIEQGGNILVGSYDENTTGNAKICLYPNNMSGTTRISFNSRYPAYQSDLDVFVGRYPERTDGRESPRLHLHGASGIEMTSDAGSIMQYDADTYGDQVYFSSDVIGNFYSLSDSRFKDNVTPLTNTLSGLEQLTGVSFRLNAAPSDSTRNRMINIKNDNRTRFGFLAQEVKEVYPELVRTDSLGYMYVDYIGMIPLIVNALNEIQAKADSQEIVIARLQQELVALKNGDVETASPLHKSQRNTASAEPESAIVPTLYQNSPTPSVRLRPYGLPCLTKRFRPTCTSTICKGHRYAESKLPNGVKAR